MNGPIRADWHLAALDLPDDGDDPFDIAEVATVIDLSGAVPRISEELKLLERREARHNRNGVTCSMRQGGQDCRSCPDFTEDPFDPVHFLCRIGRRQEELADEWEMSEERARDIEAHAEAAGVFAALDHAEGAGMPALVWLAESAA